MLCTQVHGVGSAEAANTSLCAGHLKRVSTLRPPFWWAKMSSCFVRLARRTCKPFLPSLMGHFDIAEKHQPSGVSEEEPAHDEVTKLLAGTWSRWAVRHWGAPTELGASSCGKGWRPALGTAAGKGAWGSQLSQAQAEPRRGSPLLRIR